jgi:hypothetical protein
MHQDIYVRVIEEGGRKVGTQYHVVSYVGSQRGDVVVVVPAEATPTERQAALAEAQATALEKATAAEARVAAKLASKGV